MKQQIKTITIATPMAGGMCTGTYLTSVLNFVSLCASNNVSVKVSYIYNESLIQRARNDLASAFLRADSDILLFIDADIKFDAVKLFKMIMTGKDIIGAITPMKLINYAAIVESSIALKSLDKAHLVGGSYNFNKNLTEEECNDLLNDKPVEVERIGTGILSISRSALEKMIPHVGVYYNDQINKDPIKTYDFFPVGLKYEEALGYNRLMSEDFGFCNIWKKIGGKVWASGGVVETHTGTFEFSQSIIEDITVNQKVRKLMTNLEE
jgi:hypothetical protein